MMLHNIQFIRSDLLVDYGDKLTLCFMSCDLIRDINSAKTSFLADRTIGRAYGTVCRLSSVCLSSVCDVLYRGKTVRPSEKVSEGVNRKPGQKVHFFGRHHISTSGFAATATKTAVFALCIVAKRYVLAKNFLKE